MLITFFKEKFKSQDYQRYMKKTKAFEDAHEQNAGLKSPYRMYSPGYIKGEFKSSPYRDRRRHVKEEQAYVVKQESNFSIKPEQHWKQEQHWPVKQEQQYSIKHEQNWQVKEEYPKRFSDRR